ncbi:MAG: hypothetical protein N4A40_16065 [Tissierellales bacterium]|nr:hypothetical protein [Tissierellales bacterium]
MIRYRISPKLLEVFSNQLLSEANSICNSGQMILVIENGRIKQIVSEEKNAAGLAN